MAQRFKYAVGERADVRGETDAEDVEGINFAGSMREADQVHGTSAICEKRIERGFSAMLCKIAQKRITSAERKKSESDALRCGIARKNSVENFMRSAVAAHGEKPAIALAVCFARKLNGVTRAGGSDDVDVQAFCAEACKRWAGELRRFAATCGRINDREETVFGGGHGDKSGSIPRSRSSLARRSAS